MDGKRRRGIDSFNKGYDKLLERLEILVVDIESFATLQLQGAVKTLHEAVEGFERVIELIFG